VLSRDKTRTDKAADGKPKALVRNMGKVSREKKGNGRETNDGRN
jgi:hypothetical protein